MGITERYSVKHFRYSIIHNTVLKIQLLELQDLEANCVSSSSFPHFTIILFLVTINTIKELLIIKILFFPFEIIL